MLEPRPQGAALAFGRDGGGGPGRAPFRGRASLGIPPMSTWGVVTVITGWVVEWSGIGAWKMATRDA